MKSKPTDEELLDALESFWDEIPNSLKIKWSIENDENYATVVWGLSYRAIARERKKINALRRKNRG